MDHQDWDERYAATELMWSAGPNVFVEQIAGDLPPGRALDLAAGEGRNALWLAERGWDATAVDFSQVALDRARELAAQRLGADAGRFTTHRADLQSYQPPAQAYDLVLLVYLQVPADQRRTAVRAAASDVAPGGALLVIAHDTDNLAHGVGGPPNPAVLYSAADVVADLEGTGLAVARAEQVRRPVETPDGVRHALDALVLATRA